MKTGTVMSRMNDGMASRNSFIISKGFKNYFLFSMLFTVMEQLCIVVDMILVGNFVNANAFSALNLVVPIESLVIGVVMLLTGGAGVIASRQIGDQDFDGAYRTLSVSVLSTVAVMALMSVAGLFTIDSTVSILCPEPALERYLKEYLRIYYVSLIPLALYNVMILILNVDGKPDVVLWTVVSACILDILLDVVFMKQLKMGVTGTALAGAASYTVPLLFMIPYAGSRKCSFRFSVSGDAGKIFVDNAKAGLPYSSPYIAICLITFLVNTLVLVRLGSYAMYIWGAGYQILSLMIVAMDCIGGTILVIMGSMLVGCHDMDGFSILTKWCIRMSAYVVGAMLLVVMIFPAATLSLFGYDIPEDSSAALTRIRCIVFLGIPYALCCIKIYVSQALGRPLLSTVPLVIFFVLSVGGLFAWSFVEEQTMFLSFVASGVLFIVLDWMACKLLSRHLGNVSDYLLIPAQDSVRSRCLSVPYSRDGLNAALNDLSIFLEECEIPMALTMNVNLCCEELMLSIVEKNENRNLGDDWFFDVFVLDGDEDVKVTIKDAGDPFNPVRNYRDSAADAIASGEDAELSLRLVNRLCKDLSYNYMYGQNTIYMSFPK